MTIYQTSFQDLSGFGQADQSQDTQGFNRRGPSWIPRQSLADFDSEQRANAMVGGGGIGSGGGWPQTPGGGGYTAGPAYPQQPPPGGGYTAGPAYPQQPPPQQGYIGEGPDGGWGPGPISPGGQPPQQGYIGGGPGGGWGQPPPGGRYIGDGLGPIVTDPGPGGWDNFPGGNPRDPTGYWDDYAGPTEERLWGGNRPPPPWWNDGTPQMNPEQRMNDQAKMAGWTPPLPPGWQQGPGGNPMQIPVNTGGGMDPYNPASGGPPGYDDPYYTPEEMGMGTMGGGDPMNPNYLSELLGGGEGAGILPMLIGDDEEETSLPSLGGSGIPVGGYRRYGPVLGDQQIQQLINQATGANARQHGTTMRDALQNFGGRGMAGSSPAMRGVGARADLARAMADTSARTQIPIDAARLNVESAIQGDVAGARQREADIRQYLAPHQARQGYLSPLLGALSSFF